ncbi:MAG: glycosyltransferase [Candidatus Synoicihabitans palmerolidicus]|nr:glycosyltransferase [Candidatus Synoicihabitans palmerolidicus]
MVPVRFGSGTKIKVLESLANGRPVIAAKHAVRGTDLVSGVHYVEADSVQEFVEAACEMSEDHERAKGIARQGWEWARVFPAV